MEKERAIQIVKDIKEECKKHEECKKCVFYKGTAGSSLCIFTEDDLWSDAPEEWNTDALVNLNKKKEGFIMKKEEAIQIAKKIKEECGKNEECKKCVFYSKEKYGSCIFYTKSYYDNIPMNWDMDALMDANKNVVPKE